MILKKDLDGTEPLSSLLSSPPPNTSDICMQLGDAALCNSAKCMHTCADMKNKQRT